MTKSENKPMQEEKSRTPERRHSLAPYMPLTSFGPGFWPFSRLRSEFDRVFEDFFRGWGGMMTTDEPGFKWGFEIDDQDDKIVVRADAPGFQPEDFDVQIRDNQLTISACEREEQREGDGHRWRRREFYRSLPLSIDVDAEHVGAEYRNGVLTLTLPKTERAKGRRVEVKG